MKKITFISSAPYLSLRLKEPYLEVQFVKHYYSTEDPTEIKRLRAYAGINPVMIAEGGEKELEELIKRYNAFEDKLIREAEEREKARTEEKQHKKELHNFYSTLRMADGVAR